MRVSNHEVDRVYTSEDVADLDYDEDLGLPGEPPYTRGPYPTMYPGADVDDLAVRRVRHRRGNE